MNDNVHLRDVDIELLGNLSLSIRTRRIPVRAQKVRTMLAVLALHAGVVVSVDELADEMWGERHLGNPRNALQANTARLRWLLSRYPGDELGEQLIRTVGNGYLLDVAPDAVDANRFLTSTQTAAQLVQTQPGEAILRLRQALALWRGPALLDAGEGLRCQAAAVRLTERRMAAQEDLMAAHLANGDERSVISELCQLVVQHPERESLSQQLMLALYRSGRQSEALSVFHRTRTWLRKELGLEPGGSLHAMYRAILAHDPVLPGRL
jgi:DNA-binding SARP family transcriptional activator